jgi:hypothetical protein
MFVLVKIIIEVAVLVILNKYKQFSPLEKGNETSFFLLLFAVVNISIFWKNPFAIGRICFLPKL